MRRPLVWLFVALAVVAGAWWMRGAPRRGTNLEPLTVERVAREAVRDVELVAPALEAVQDSAIEASATASPERVEVELESPAASAKLLVLVFDAAGNLPIQGTRIPSDGRDLLDRERPRLYDWPEHVVVLAFEHDDLDGLGTAVGRALKRVSDGEEQFEFEGIEGGRYLIGAIGPGFDGSLREVDVPRGKDRVVVDLHARELGELARLSVRVTSNGRPLDEGTPEDPFRIELQGEDGHELRSMRCDGVQAPFQLRAPAGNYRIVVEGSAVTSSFHGYVEHARSLGRSEQMVQLVAGCTAEVELEIRGGARLEVTLAGEVDEADIRVARERTPLGQWLDDIHEVEAMMVELYVVSDGRRREPVLLGLCMEETSDRQYLVNQWRLNATAVSECLPTGHHTLIARLPGGREARAEVELFEGRTTPVRLRF